MGTLSSALHRLITVAVLGVVLFSFANAKAVSAFVSTKRTHRLLRSLPTSFSSSSSSPSPRDTISNANVTIQRDSDLLSSARPNGSRREPPYPESAYNLRVDEENIQHNFVSFIDRSPPSDYSQVFRLVEPRIYARQDQFDKNMANVPPTIDDVAPPPSLYGPFGKFLAWNKLPARLIVGTMSYMSFPYFVLLLRMGTDGFSDQALSELVDQFLPGISIVLGTYISLTLSILYDRKARIQRTVALEAGLLALTCQNLLELFVDDEEGAVEGAQCVADQIRTLVRDSRGREIMGVIYSDPYARIRRLIKDRDKGGLDSNLVSEIRNAVRELYTLRTKRVSDEALALAPPHYDVMTLLSGLLVTGFALGSIASEQTESILTKTLFAALVASYTIFYEMMFDLNRPFDGVYQVRRSTAAMYFLQTKHLLSKNPLVKGKVDFETVRDEENIPSSDCNAECDRKKQKVWYN